MTQVIDLNMQYFEFATLYRTFPGGLYKYCSRSTICSLNLRSRHVSKSGVRTLYLKCQCHLLHDFCEQHARLFSCNRQKLFRTHKRKLKHFRYLVQIAILGEYIKVAHHFCPGQYWGDWDLKVPYNVVLVFGLTRALDIARWLHSNIS